MNTTKIIIGSTILIGAAGLAYVLMKRSQSSWTDKTLPAGDTYADEPWFGSSSGTTSTSPATSSRASKYPEGTLLRAGNSPEVYLIDAKGYRHWITSRSAFDRLSLSMANVKSITAGEMESIPRAENIAGLGILL